MQQVPHAAGHLATSEQPAQQASWHLAAGSSPSQPSLDLHTHSSSGGSCTIPSQQCWHSHLWPPSAPAHSQLRAAYNAHVASPWPAPAGHSHQLPPLARQTDGFSQQPPPKLKLQIRPAAAAAIAAACHIQEAHHWAVYHSAARSPAPSIVQARCKVRSEQLSNVPSSQAGSGGRAGDCLPPALRTLHAAQLQAASKPQ